MSRSFHLAEANRSQQADELARLEGLLTRISAAAKYWWLGSVAVGLLGALTLSSGVLDWLASGQRSGLLYLGALLIALAIAAAADGIYWRKVGRYIELRRGTAGRSEGARSLPSVEKNSTRR